MLDILLVDDDPDLRASLGQMLCDEGHTVDVAPDGETATHHKRSLRTRVLATFCHRPVTDRREHTGKLSRTAHFPGAASSVSWKEEGCDSLKK
jgi:DNA-binding response OmpR family regulator